MGFTQKDLAERFGADVQTIANYEKGKKIPPISEQLMRMTFVLWIMPPDARAEVMKQITDEVQERKAGRKAHNPMRRSLSYPGIIHLWQQNKMCPS